MRTVGSWSISLSTEVLTGCKYFTPTLLAIVLQLYSRTPVQNDTTTLELY